MPPTRIRDREGDLRRGLQFVARIQDDPGRTDRSLWSALRFAQELGATATQLAQAARLSADEARAFIAGPRPSGPEPEAPRRTPDPDGDRRRATAFAIWVHQQADSGPAARRGAVRFATQAGASLDDLSEALGRTIEEIEADLAASGRPDVD